MCFAHLAEASRLPFARTGRLVIRCTATEALSVQLEELIIDRCPLQERMAGEPLIKVSDLTGARRCLVKFHFALLGFLPLSHFLAILLPTMVDQIAD